MYTRQRREEEEGEGEGGEMGEKREGTVKGGRGAKVYRKRQSPGT